VQAAIVDLDGTMIDTLGDFVVALGAVLSGFGLPPVDRAFVERTVGKGSEHLVRSTLAHAGADAGLYDMAMARYQHHYLAINGQHAAVYPGVVEGLERMRAHGLKLACLTNKPAAFALPLLRSKGLADYFSHVFGGDAFERKKPDPLPLLKTCEALVTQPANTLMVGDSSNDAQAARAAGCPVVLVSYGYNHGRPVAEVDADATVDRLDCLEWAGVARFQPALDRPSTRHRRGVRTRR
jgi:phosphoglycolate phosphatase